eukprot:CCRYP_014391-RA/>CCRYP_014391-RA protein AED:0.04 eAED:0.04 QI:171/1/1/1/1/1/2/56/452
MTDADDGNDRHDDLIVDEGFAVLNNFQPKKASDGVDSKNSVEKIVDPIPRYSFASFADTISMPFGDQRESFLNDCSLVFTARTKEDSESYSTGETFFLPCLMKPRCALEALAHTIFHAHVDGLEGASANGSKKSSEHGDMKSLLYDPERSGAEWWTLVLDAPSADGKEDTNQEQLDDDEEEEDDEVGMHFDADYGLEAQISNFMLHPRVGTITYLSDIGVPTLILDKRSPAPSDVEKKSLGGDINRAWLSHPRFGKHVAFDGRLLHGAPGKFFPAVAESVTVTEPKTKKAKVEEKECTKHQNPLSGKRITFLVNIWLNHCPIDADILDEDVVSKLTTVWENPTNGKTKADESYCPPFKWNLKDVSVPDDLGEAVTLTAAPTESDGPAGVEEDLVICNRQITMIFGATMESFHDVSNFAAMKGSAEITMGNGVLTLGVGNEVNSDDEDSGEDS